MPCAARSAFLPPRFGKRGGDRCAEFRGAREAMKSFVLCRVPRAGLGNQLLVWAKALAYAHNHDLEMVHWGWSVPSQTRISRIRQGNETWISRIRPSPLPLLASSFAKALYCERVYEPGMSHRPQRDGVAYAFSRVPPWQDYFADFRDRRSQVIAGLWDILRPSAASAAESLEPPRVVVNVRMGDFRVVSDGVDFSKVGQHRTPLGYFRSAIEGIRHFSGWQTPVHVVSDGTRDELAPLLAIENVTLAPQRPAIVQLLWMRRAQAIVCSAGSTFGFWAGFLGEAALLHHPAHTPKPVRAPDGNGGPFDGAAGGEWRDWPRALMDNLRNIKPV